ncbi:MAG: hypothetical protein FJ290_21480 [Planctomycetes bacterium]|nr:hypothetical protein [Planctomycetota bacterium]
MRRIATVACVLLAASARAATLKVGTVYWGFNGTVVPGRINLLSVELANPSPVPFDGELRLYKDSGVGGRVDASLVEPCFLSPDGHRWVQFYPYVRGEHEAWLLEWGPGADDRCELGKLGALGKLTLGPPARVALYDPGAATGMSGDPSIKHFPDHLFPVTVAATDGLHSVVLSHAPRWEPVRQQAFLDWLRRGGELHIVQGDGGRYPTFSDELAVLNSPRERQHVGGGLVLRHAVRPRDVTNDFLDKAGCPPCEFAPEPNYSGMNDLEQPLLRALSGITRPKHAWGLIYLTALAYIVVLGPLNYVFGRKRRNYRLTVLFFLGSVAAAAFVMHVLGRRGFGEAAAVHSLACARQIDADTYDVTQWANVFVTRGAEYRIAHAAPHNLYSGCSDHEAIRGVIMNGRDGAFVVDIPLYSHRPFLHRAKLTGDHIQLKVVAWRGTKQLEELVLALEAGFPEALHDMWALHGGLWYRLARQGSELRAATPGRQMEHFFPDQLPDDLAPPWQRGWRYGQDSDDDEVPPERVLARYRHVLAAREVGGSRFFLREFARRPPDDEHAQVFLFARAPQGFAVQGGRFGRQVGFVLYCVDVFRPGDGGPAP